MTTVATLFKLEFDPKDRDSQYLVVLLGDTIIAKGPNDDDDQTASFWRGASAVADESRSFAVEADEHSELWEDHDLLVIDEDQLLVLHKRFSLQDWSKYKTLGLNG